MSDVRRAYVSQVQQIPLAHQQSGLPSAKYTSQCFTEYDSRAVCDNPFPQDSARKDEARGSHVGSNWQTTRMAEQQQFQPSETPTYQNYSSHMNAYENANDLSQAKATDYSSHGTASQCESDWSKAQRNDVYLNVAPSATNPQHQAETPKEYLPQTVARITSQTGNVKGFGQESYIQQEGRVNHNPEFSRGFHHPSDFSAALNNSQHPVASHKGVEVENGANVQSDVSHGDGGERINRESSTDGERRKEGIKTLLNSSSIPNAGLDSREGTAQYCSAAGDAEELESGNNQRSAIPTISQALRTVPPLNFATTPHGRAPWPNSPPSADGENAIPLTPFFNMDSFSTRGRSANPFATSSSKNLGFLPLTPRFFGMDPLQSTRSLYQSQISRTGLDEASSQQEKNREPGEQSKLSER